MLLEEFEHVAYSDEVEDLFFNRLRTSVEQFPTFVGKVEALLDEAVRLSRTNPAIAGLVLSMAGGSACHPDLGEALEAACLRRDAFFAEVIDAGIANCELVAADRQVVLDTLTSTLTGLLVLGTVIPGAQKRALQGFKRLLAGTLMAGFR